MGPQRSFDPFWQITPHVEAMRGMTADPPAVRSSPTSVAAAESVKGTVDRDRERVLGVFRDRGGLGATDDEVQVLLGMAGDTERPRRIELLDMGLIVKTLATRRTRKNRQAAVWRIA